jgi:hypothetical protein
MQSSDALSPQIQPRCHLPLAQPKTSPRFPLRCVRPRSKKGSLRAEQAIPPFKPTQKGAETEIVQDLRFTVTVTDGIKRSATLYVGLDIQPCSTLSPSRR